MANLNISVSASSDDAEEFSAPAVPNLTSSDLDFFAGAASNVGIRFQNVTIPAGSTILSVVIRFTARNTWSGNAHNQTIYCEDIDDAPTFTTAVGNVSTRDKTTASTPWTAGPVAAEDQYDTPDFTAALQEVIDRPGWATGQDIAVLFRGGAPIDNQLDAWSHNHGSDVPQIRITYTSVLAGYALVF